MAAGSHDGGTRAGLLVVVVGLVLAWFWLPRHDAPAEASYGEMLAASPVRLRIRAIHVDAAVVPVQVSSDAVLDPPRDYREVGWWDRSAEPGADDGQTVITGHTVHTGGGSMDDVGRLHDGQKVDVVTRSGTMRYEVSDVRVLSQAALARSAPRLFGQRHGAGRLVLVSCTDWNGSSYDSNVVVLARPLGVPQPSARRGGRSA